jgi:hypothetical protein
MRINFKKMKETSDSSVQTQPNLESKVTWTGEPNYTRYFIVRIFKPQEYSAKSLQFKITLGEDTYTSKNFNVKKGEKVNSFEIEL